MIPSYAKLDNGIVKKGKNEQRVYIIGKRYIKSRDENVRKHKIEMPPPFL